MMIPLLRDWDFDVLITHNRFTLANRNAEAMLTSRSPEASPSSTPRPMPAASWPGVEKYPLCLSGGVRRRADPIRRIEPICARHGVPTGAAALQFSMRDPRVNSTICGVAEPGHVNKTLDWARFPIPEVVWEELKAAPASTDDPEATREYRPG